MLDDSLAMSPNAKLSGATNVVVGARIAKSGNAVAQDGVQLELLLFAHSPYDRRDPGELSSPDDGDSPATRPRRALSQGLYGFGCHGRSSVRFGDVRLASHAMLWAVIA